MILMNYKYVFKSILSGNISMYVSENIDNKNIIIINFGKIPPNEELMVISEFIHIFSPLNSMNLSF